MSWFYHDVVFEEPEEQHYGFVYQITNLITGKKYIGKKLFWFKKTKVLKGKRKRYLAPSDWKTYYGSSVSLKADVELHGTDNFKREILKLCKSKGECSYYEARFQFQHDVLLNPDEYYNDWIICRVHRRHVYGKS
jgi:Putative endonuclease segE, GIY-YIG domain